MLIIAVSFFYNVVRIKIGIDLRFSFVHGYLDLCESVAVNSSYVIKCEDILLLNQKRGKGFGIDFRQFDSSDVLGLGYLIDSGFFIEGRQKVYMFPFFKPRGKVGCSFFLNFCFFS